MRYYVGVFEDEDDREDFVNHEWVRLCQADSKQVLINKATAERLRIDANKWCRTLPLASRGKGPYSDTNKATRLRNNMGSASSLLRQIIRCLLAPTFCYRLHIGRCASLVYK